MGGTSSFISTLEDVGGCEAGMEGGWWGWELSVLITPVGPRVYEDEKTL